MLGQRLKSPRSNKVQEALDAFCRLRLHAGIRTNLQRAMNSAPEPSRRRMFTKKRRWVRGHYMGDKSLQFSEDVTSNTTAVFNANQHFQKLWRHLSNEERVLFYKQVKEIF